MNRVIVVQIRGVCFLAFPPRPAVEVVLMSAAVLRTAEVSTSSVVESLWNRTSRSAAVPYPKHGCRTESDTLPVAATAAAVTTSSSSSKRHSCFWCVYTYTSCSIFHLAHKSLKYFCLPGIDHRHTNAKNVFVSLEFSVVAAI